MKTVQLRTHSLRAKRSTRFMGLLLCALVAWTGLFTTAASAAMVSTGEVISEQRLDHDKAELKKALQQENVRERLLSLGVSPEEVDARIDALSATELATLHAQMDELPAGSGAVGLLALLVLIFFVTDILGVTDVFPFVHPAN